MGKIIKIMTFSTFLALQGCDWFSSSKTENKSPEAIYTAEFELQNPAPELAACEGEVAVNYKVAKCFKDGVETSVSDCQNMSKNPELFKSPEGIGRKGIKNDMNQVIGYSEHNCLEGDLPKLDNKLDITCSDSRYIKQEVEGTDFCNPYLFKSTTQYSYIASTEKNKFYSTPETSSILKQELRENTFQEFLDFYKYGNFLELILKTKEIGYVQYYSLTKVSYFSELLTLDEIKVIPDRPLCIMDINNKVACQNGEEGQWLKTFLDDSIDIKIYNQTACATKSNGKVYCSSIYASYLGLDTNIDYYNSRQYVEMTFFEGSTDYLVSRGGVCVNKLNKGYCAGSLLDDEFVLVSNENIKMMEYINKMFCFLTESNKVLCAGIDDNHIVSKNQNFFGEQSGVIDIWPNTVDKIFNNNGNLCVLLIDKRMYCSGIDINIPDDNIVIPRQYFFPGYN